MNDMKDRIDKVLIDFEDCIISRLRAEEEIYREVARQLRTFNRNDFKTTLAKTAQAFDDAADDPAPSCFHDDNEHERWQT